MRFLIIVLCLFLLAGCKNRDSDIIVLGDSTQTAQTAQNFVVNGGPGSTEAAYEDVKGQKMSVASNVVKVPIVEKCNEEKKVEEPKEIPEETPVRPVEEPLPEKKPEVMYGMDVLAFQNHVVSAGYREPYVSYLTDVEIELAPPEIKLEKSSDEDRLCCDRQLTFRIKYTNIGGQEAHNVKVEDIIPARVEYVEESAGSQPHPTNITVVRDDLKKPQKIVWQIEGTLAPNASGEVFYTVACPNLRPKLSCYIKFEPKALNVGQQGKMICNVVNSGTGSAENTNITVEIPQGIEYQGQSLGKKEVFQLGIVEAGKTVSKELPILMRSGGRLDQVVAKVACSNGEPCDCFVPPAPTLQVQKTGPELVDNRLPIEYTIVVKNISQENAPATNCVLTDLLPPFVNFKSATENGVYDSKKNTVIWQLGTLVPGAIVTRNVVVFPQKAGDFVDKAEVTCEEGITVNDQAKTSVRGIAAIGISKYDTEDPVEVGGTTTYIIDVINEGFKDCTGVKVSSDIGASVELITASGRDNAGNPVGYKLEGTKVVFDVVPSLPSGEKMAVKITVKVKDKTEIHNSTSVSYNEFSKTIVVDEPTSVY